MAASSAQSIVWRSICYFVSMCVVTSVFGLVSPAHSAGFPLICEPSVYTKSLGLHFLLWGFVSSIVVVAYGCIDMGVSL
jgi:hypothetical protein